MKSSPHGSIPNMKGKKSHALGCGCCDAFDYRERERIKTMMREGAAELTDPTNVDDGGHYITINDVDYYI